MKPRRSRLSTTAALLAALACAGDPAADPDSRPSQSRDATPGSTPLFVESAESTGLDFAHFNGMTGEYLMAEVTGSGVALADFDNDGDLDAYFLQGTVIGRGKTLADARFPTSYPSPITDRLYRNDSSVRADGSRELRFTDITDGAGLEATAYGMGIASGDFDDDGFIDLYITNLGPNQLLRNDGRLDGGISFTDVAAAAGVDDPRWSVPATFLDFDLDGRLDLFVGSYIAYDPESRTVCRDFTGALDYCGPGSAPPTVDRLFRNVGDGRFEDRTVEAGFGAAYGGALGAVAADFNGDRRPDLYVANDSMANNLWLNNGDGTFSDDALYSGCAVNADGKAEASMGVDAGDYDADGDLDLFMTHLTGETNTLYVNNGQGVFDDATIPSGLGPPSRLFTSFGTAWLDFDNDGWLDVFTVNGAVKKIEDLARQDDLFPVHQSNQLFRNLGPSDTGRVRFAEVTEDAGEAFSASEVSRGAAVGDIDNDGDIDLLIVNNNGPARLVLNQIANRRWLGLRLLGGEGPRDMLGARAAVYRDGLPTLWRRVRTDGGFASAHDSRVLFGLDASTAIEKVRVEWPDGSTEEWYEIPIERYTDLLQGSGQSVTD